MKISFTPNDLILFAYSDTKGTREQKFYEEMQTDKRLLNEFRNILGLKLCVDSTFVAPDKRIVNNILNYSRSLAVYKTESIGMVNIFMN